VPGPRVGRWLVATQGASDAADTTSLYGAVWAPVAALFNDQRPGAKKVTWAIDTVLQDKKLLVIDLSGKGSEGL